LIGVIDRLSRARYNRAMTISILLLLLGLIALVFGGDFLVRGAVGIAKRLGISPLLIGVTVVAWGTSTPELLVSVDAAMAGSPGIAIGNVVGSNICNILLILGIAAVIRPIVFSQAAIARDGSFALLAVMIFITLALMVPIISWPYGVGMIVVLAGMVWLTYKQERTAVAGGGNDDIDVPVSTLGRSLAWTGGGLALLVVGADLLVDNAIVIARSFNVSESVIGLSLVAVGTSLPELFTSVMAAIRKQDDVALGNVVGSNIYNIMAILGVTAIISPIPVPEQMLKVDMWVMLAATLALVPAYFARRIGRGYGIAMLLAYAGYMGWLFNNSTFN
jgi:cation:H+ antiporter